MNSSSQFPCAAVWSLMLHTGPVAWVLVQTFHYKSSSDSLLKQHTGKPSMEQKSSSAQVSFLPKQVGIIGQWGHTCSTPPLVRGESGGGGAWGAKCNKNTAWEQEPVLFTRRIIWEFQFSSSAPLPAQKTWCHDRKAQKLLPRRLMPSRERPCLRPSPRFSGSCLLHSSCRL